MKRIHGHLSEHRDQAFTEEELREAFGDELIEFYRGRPVFQQALAAVWAEAGVGAPDIMAEAINKLLELDVVEARIVGSQTYYAYLRELPDL
jgi:hypothetical protein